MQPQRLRNPRCLTLATGLAVIALSMAAAAVEPWLAGPFCGDAKATLEAAEALPVEGTPDIHILLDETSVAFDDKGLRTTEKRMVYRVLNAKGVEDWSTVRVSYDPWFQDRPVVQARVVTLDGREHLLGVSNLTEGKQGETGQNTFSDRVNLAGPLPGVAIGALVEQRVTLAEHHSFFTAGVTSRFGLAYPFPCHRLRFRITQPLGRPVAMKWDLMFPGSTNRSVSNRQEIIAFEFGSLPAQTNFNIFLSPEVPPVPLLTLSTGTTWQAVAQAYHRLTTPGWQDLPGKVLPAKPAVAETDRTRAIQECLEQVHRDLRYTAVEFGQNSIVPRSPDACLQTRYGDCKEKSSLLVALLSARKIEARLALIQTGPRYDVDPGLPGLGLFDHVLVYLPGPQPLFVDATDEFGRIGSLPYGDQGRSALIIDPSTRGLVKTPVMPAESNRELEVREVRLATYGPATVVQSTTWTGPRESAMRAAYGGGDTNKLMEFLGKATRETYGSRTPPGLRHSPSRDFSNDFRVDLTVEKAAFMDTDMSHAQVALDLKGLFSDVADVFMPTRGGNPGEDGGDEGKVADRQMDWVMVGTGVRERVYRILPPPGFRLRQMPTDETRTMGPSTLTRQYSRLSNGFVEARTRFDMGPVRFSPESGRALKEGLATLDREDRVVLQFMHEGSLDMEEGRVAEGMAAFRSSLEGPGPRTLALCRYAHACLDLGLGDKARALVREAVANDPTNAVAWLTQGRILEANTYGLPLVAGMDWTGATAAYEKALALDPKFFLARVHLARLCEYGPDGRHFGPSAPLARSASNYLPVFPDLSQEYQKNLAMVYLYSKRPREALETLRKIQGNGPDVRLLIMAAMAMKDGPRAAVVQAEKEAFDAGERAKTLQQVAGLLLVFREYPTGAQVLRSASRYAANPGQVLDQISVFERMTHRTAPLELGPDPRSTVACFVDRLLPGSPAHDRLAEVFATNMWRDLQTKTGRKSFLAMTGGLATGLMSSGLSLEVSRDFLHASMQIQVEGGGDKPYARALVRYQQRKQVYYLGKEGNAWKIFTLDLHARALGVEIWGLAQKGDWNSARDLLDWLREDEQNDANAPKVPGIGIWKSVEGRGPDEIRLAAAAMAAPSPLCPEALAFLDKAIASRAWKSKEAVLEVARYWGEQAQSRWETLAARSGQNQARFPTNVEYAFQSAQALEGMGKKEAAWRACEAGLRIAPKNIFLLRQGSELMFHLGRVGESVELCQRVAAHPAANAIDWNRLAWRQMFLPDVPPDVVEDAGRACKIDQYQETSLLHTLAVAMAETRKVRETLGLIAQILERGRATEIDADLLYLTGRLAEVGGELAEARRIYERCSRISPPSPDDPGLTSDLARGRLKRMK